MQNGEYSTRNFSVSHRIGKECTLSDILEDTVDARYFLSDKSFAKLIYFEDMGNIRKNREGLNNVIQIAMCKAERNNPNQYRVYSKYGISPCLNKAEGGGRTPYIYQNEKRSD